MLVAKLQHRNLVRLLGFCLEGTERILIYEFVTNSSLDNFIFDPINRSQLDWDKRYKIIRGIARGLLYLHFLWRYGGPNRKVHLIHSVWANFQTSINNVKRDSMGCFHSIMCRVHHSTT
ncbi:unnamed protein product [Camellia sinensis]